MSAPDPPVRKNAGDSIAGSGLHAAVSLRGSRNDLIEFFKPDALLVQIVSLPLFLPWFECEISQNTEPDMCIGCDVRIKGDLNFSVLLRIDGQVEGRLAAPMKVSSALMLYSQLF